MNPEPEPDAPRPPVPPAEPPPAAAGPREADAKTIALAEVLPADLDYEVLNLIGYGGYGEVYLARAKDGSFFAVKVVYRVSFEDQRPYEREYEGIRYFEPVSKLSESQLQILRVGRRDEAGYFYYIMEAADDLSAGREILPTTYIPRTLKSEMQQHGGRIPVRACCEIGLALAAALENLHSHRLVHRDIKPANIIFVHNSAKLADPGLVAAANQTLTCVGTEGYIPPEGPGSPLADIYALGMVLYEAFTGFRRQDFPKLPADLADWPEHALVLKLNKIVTNACQANPRQRYQSARAMHRDLEKLVERDQGTASAPTLFGKRLVALGVILLLVAAGMAGFQLWQNSSTVGITASPQLKPVAGNVLAEPKFARANECFQGIWFGRAKLGKFWFGRTLTITMSSDGTLHALIEYFNDVCFSSSTVEVNGNHLKISYCANPNDASTTNTVEGDMDPTTGVFLATWHWNDKNGPQSLDFHIARMCAFPPGAVEPNLVIASQASSFEGVWNGLVSESQHRRTLVVTRLPDGLHGAVHFSDIGMTFQSTSFSTAGNHFKLTFPYNVPNVGCDNNTLEGDVNFTSGAMQAVNHFNSGKSTSSFNLQRIEVFPPTAPPN